MEILSVSLSLSSVERSESIRVELEIQKDVVQARNVCNVCSEKKQEVKDKNVEVDDHQCVFTVERVGK